MNSLNATELQITRWGTIGPYKCKVGPCRKCGGVFRHCKCRCEGYSVNRYSRMYAKERSM